MAEINHPKSKFGSRPAPNDGPDTDGFAVTPVEGLDRSDVPKVPMDPSEVLELLKARLALDDGEVAQLDALMRTSSYEAAQALPRSWPPKDTTPSSPDITPSPVVIGVEELEAMIASEHAMHEPQRKTPAEPVASVRVRQASVSPPAAEEPATEQDRWNLQHLGSAAGSLYFPPMRPPDSWQNGHSNEPLVQVVPDCDSKVKTARSLRRNSNWPTPSYLSELQRRPSILLASAVSVLVILGIALIVAPPNRSGPSPKPPISAPRLASAIPLAAPLPSADAGAIKNTLAPSPPPSIPHSTSAAASDRAPNPLIRKNNEKSGESKPAKVTKPLTPKADRLIF